MCVRLHHLAEMMPSRAGELSYMTLATEREQTAFRSLLQPTAALPPDPEPTLLRLVHGCIAMPFTARVRAVAPSGKLSNMRLTTEREQTAFRSLQQPTAERHSRPTPSRPHCAWCAGASPCPSLLVCVRLQHHLAEMMPSRAVSSAT